LNTIEIVSGTKHGGGGAVVDVVVLVVVEVVVVTTNVGGGGATSVTPVTGSVTGVVPDDAGAGDDSVDAALDESLEVDAVFEDEFELTTTTGG
jgi:hypothetical protein